MHDDVELLYKSPHHQQESGELQQRAEEKQLAPPTE
jgi:hypothetical protein